MYLLNGIEQKQTITFRCAENDIQICRRLSSLALPHARTASHLPSVWTVGLRREHGIGGLGKRHALNSHACPWPSQKPPAANTTASDVQSSDHDTDRNRAKHKQGASRCFRLLGRYLRSRKDVGQGGLQTGKIKQSQVHTTRIYVIVDDPSVALGRSINSAS